MDRSNRHPQQCAGLYGVFNYIPEESSRESLPAAAVH
jgi:hypothetical protein